MNRAIQFTRMSVLFVAIVIVGSLIIMRLFSLQILAHAKYQEIAQREQYGYTTLPARRGEILIEDYHSGEDYKLATNTTLNMVFADPTLIEDAGLVAETMAPFLFDLEIEQEIEEQRFEEEYEVILKIENEVLREEALNKLGSKTDEELKEQFEKNLSDTLDQKTRDIILIAEELDEETQAELKALNLSGTELSENGNLYAYPAQISDKANIANKLADVFHTDAKDLERILLGKNRFVILKRKLEPEVSRAIDEILLADRELEEPQFLGIRMREEYFRYYPEAELSAQLLGYVNSAGDGQYGVEGSYDDILKGTDGIFTSQIDAYGNQITVGESVIEQAQDGANVTLTIDRAIQLQVERFLETGVKEYRADAGQAIVINPQTGAILAMAHYPSFDPNLYGDVFEKEKIELSDEDKENLYITGTEEEPRYWLYIQVDPDVRIELFLDKEAEEETYYKYLNEVGPEVYKNKTIQEVYEPGSIFKPVVMSAAISAGELTPNSTFVDDGCVEVDFNSRTKEYDFCINNFDKQHHGIQTMTQVLQKSNNVGMVHVARQLGGALFYSYIKAFGFLERTDLGLDDEVTGKVEHYDGWTESEMVTKAFGQGISMSPLQLVQAYTALANNGTAMQPQLVKRIEYADGRIEEIEPKIHEQVLTEEASEMVTAMMAATGESYLSLALDHHYVAMKSGTAQTYKWGKALSGPGTTKAGFVAYGPIDNPQFLTLVKLDHPRTVEWGAATAGPVSKNILEFLFDYYNLPPDKSKKN